MADKFLKVTFQFNEKDLAKFNKLLEQSDINAKELKKDTEEAGKVASNSFDQASKGINQLVTGVKAFIALELVGRLKDAAVEASKVAAAGEGIRSAFTNLGGSVTDINRLRDAVGGTVSDINLLKIAVQAMQKGVSMDALTKTLAYLDKQADATGDSLEAMADIMINSIGKESSRGLNQVGLSMKTIEQRGKEIGFMPALFEEMEMASSKLGEVNSKTADSYDQLAASQANLQEAFGNLINSKPFLDLQAFISGGLQDLADFLNDPSGIKGKSTESLVGEVKTLQAEFDKLEKEYQRLGFSPFRRKAIVNRQEVITEEIRELSEEYNKRWQAEQQLIKKNEADKLKVEQDSADEAKEKRKEAAKLKADDQAKWEREAYEDALKRESENIDSALMFWNKGREDVREGLDELNEQANKILTSNGDNQSQDSVVEATDQVKVNFDDALDSVIQMAAILNGLNDEKGGAKKFIASIAAAAGVLGQLLPGSGLGTFSKILTIPTLFLNKGGVVPGDGPNVDSVPALLTKGEYVTNRKASKMSPLLLDAINSGEMDDRMFKKLTQTTIVNVDQAQVVEAIKSIPQTDFYLMGSTLYEARIRAGKTRKINRRVIV